MRARSRIGWTARSNCRCSTGWTKQGWELWAIYHSHTHSEAYPSETDRRLAFYPESRYMVLSLANRERPELRSFFIEDGEVTEEELTIG